MSERILGLAFLALIFVGLAVPIILDEICLRCENKKKAREEKCRREFFRHYEEARKHYG